MKRRTFLKACGAACAGSTTFSCASTDTTISKEVKNNSITVSSNDFFDVESMIHKDYVLLSTSLSRFPIALHKRKNGTYSAMLMSCTHQACMTVPQNNTYICPCHGSRFDLEGRVLKGPATTALQSYKVTANGDSITIQL